MDPRLPNFLIVGAAKSGTTSLWQYLIQHPDVFMPDIKETFFFVSSIYQRLSPRDPQYELLRRQTVCRFEDYLANFRAARNQKAVGEASTPYLYYHAVAIPEIRKYLGEVRIIIILRNPVDRAFSAYTFDRRDGSENLPFEECLELEAKRREENWGMVHFYQDAGFYARQVRAYQEAFRDVKVCLFDDLSRDALSVVRDLYLFLGVDPSFRADVSTRHNTSGVPKSAALHRLVSRGNPLKTALRPLVRMLVPQRRRRRWMEEVSRRNLERLEMSPATRARLCDLYREDVAELSAMIGRDLSRWVVPEAPG